ncbi:MAG: hypothetical protein FWG87_14430 [Defluviitaleaceae bacterium]|nr:hypothetical protein [Defluviitaleaceae bacterium]
MWTLKTLKRGFNGFSRIWRIGSWENISPFSNLRGQNPRNPCKSVLPLPFKSAFYRRLLNPPPTKNLQLPPTPPVSPPP